MIFHNLLWSAPLVLESHNVEFIFIKDPRYVHAGKIFDFDNNFGYKKQIQISGGLLKVISFLIFNWVFILKDHNYDSSPIISKFENYGFKVKEPLDKWQNFCANFNNGPTLVYMLLMDSCMQAKLS